MQQLPDLEIGLQHRDKNTYSLELRLSSATSETDQRYTSLTPVRFDDGALDEQVDDPAAYGLTLAGQLFADPTTRSFFDQAVAVAQAQNLSLRLRLAIGTDAPELHSLHWETLRLPGSDGPLLAGETLRFSRYLTSLDWRPVALRPETALRALVVVASPSDLATSYQMSEVDAEVEVAAARAGLGPIPSDLLATRGQVTLDNLTRQLRTGYDILYLVAHGLLDNDEPLLFLEKEDGTTAIVSGRDLVQRIRELQERPRLVVLASCQSAGNTRDRGSLASLGPRLAEAGVPAVIAMQDDVSIETIERFTPTFFEELRRDGQIDRAMAVARGVVRSRPDWWVPVLFMRLRSGRIGYKPGLATSGRGCANGRPLSTTSRPVAARRSSAPASLNGFLVRAARSPNAGPRPTAFPWLQPAAKAYHRSRNTSPWHRTRRLCATSCPSTCARRSGSGLAMACRPS